VRLNEVAALAERLRGDPRLSDAKWVVGPSHLRTRPRARNRRRCSRGSGHRRCAVAVSLHATSPNQAGDVQNRYDVIASAQFRAT